VALREAAVGGLVGVASSAEAFARGFLSCMYTESLCKRASGTPLDRSFSSLRARFLTLAPSESSVGIIGRRGTRYSKPNPARTMLCALERTGL